MITQVTLEEVKKRLIKVYNPLKIYVFGSYAWGGASEESDLDLLIVVEHADKKDFWRANAGDEALVGLGISRDIIVYTQEEFDRMAEKISSLCYKIKKDGKLLYARS